MEGGGVRLCAKSPVALLVDSSSSSFHKGIPREWGPKAVAQMQHSRDSRAVSPVALQPQQGGIPGSSEVAQPGLTPALDCSQTLLFLLTAPCLCPDLKGRLFQQESLLFWEEIAFLVGILKWATVLVTMQGWERECTPEHGPQQHLLKHPQILQQYPE